MASLTKWSDAPESRTRSRTACASQRARLRPIGQQQREVEQARAPGRGLRARLLDELEQPRRAPAPSVARPSPSASTSRPIDLR